MNKKCLLFSIATVVTGLCAEAVAAAPTAPIDSNYCVSPQSIDALSQKYVGQLCTAGLFTRSAIAQYQNPSDASGGRPSVSAASNWGNNRAVSAAPANVAAQQPALTAPAATQSVPPATAASTSNSDPNNIYGHS